jgi:uncharacterized repeat protein (TIGR01451 family)
MTMAITRPRNRGLRRWLAASTAVLLLLAMTGPGVGALAFAASDSAGGPSGPTVEAPAPEPSPPADPPKDEPKEQPAAENPAPEQSPPADQPPANDGGGSGGGEVSGDATGPECPPSQEQAPTTVEPPIEQPTLSTGGSFSAACIATVRAKKFHDLDGDGATRNSGKDAESGEPAVQGWTFTLKQYTDAACTGDPIWTDTKTTNSSGEVLWTFTSANRVTMPGGARAYYKLVEGDGPVGETWTNISTKERKFELVDYANQVELFLNQKQLTINNSLSGHKFDHGDGDKGLNDWTIKLFKDGVTAAIDTTVTKTVGGQPGHWAFYNLPHGDYYVEEVIPVGSGWVQKHGPSYPSGGSKVHMDATTVASGYDFKNELETINNSLSGRKLDHGDDDKGLNDWTIKLFKVGESAAVETTVTKNKDGEPGHWAFYNLPHGDYYVEEVIPVGSGWVQKHGPSYPGGGSTVHMDRTSNECGYNFKNKLEVIDNEISGHKFADVDDDSLAETGEPGLAGWTIELYRSGTTDAVDSTVTSGGGHWAFYDVAPGVYSVKEVLKSGWEQNRAPTGTFTMDHDTPRTGLDFWNFKPGTVDVYKFNDINGDTLENGLDDGRVQEFTLTGPDGPATASTNADGNLSFTNLKPGDYELSEAAPTDGYESTGRLPVEFTLELGGSYSIIIGNTDYASVSVFKFNDRDGDGGWDEAPLEEGLIRSFTLEGPAGPSSETTTAATDSSGNLKFEHLKPGTYTLTESALSGWFAGSTWPVTFTLVGGEAYSIDVPNTEFAKVDVFKFNDLDGDGNWDDEPGLAREFRLEGPAGPSSAVVTGTTDADGNLSFTGLKPGSYTLDEETVVGWYQSTSAVPAEFDLTGGETKAFQVGNTQYGDLNGIKFNDLNGNGANNGEPMLADWRIVLYKLADQRETFTTRGISIAAVETTPTAPLGYYRFADTLTLSDGSYSFGNLTPGTYFLAEEPQSGWIRTVSPLEPIIVQSGSSIHGLDFGNWIPFLPFTDPDLGIEKSVSPTVVDPGQEVVYTLKYFNDGAGSATDFVIVDDYDETKMDVVNAAGGTVSGGKIKWLIAGPLAAGASATITYRMRVHADVALGTVIDNTAEISLADIFDPTMGDNSDVARITVGEPFLPFTGSDFTMLLIAAAALALAGALIRRSAHRKAA